MTRLGEESILVPVGTATADFRGVIRLNETAAFIVEQIKNGASAEQIADAITREYEIDRDAALRNVESVIAKLMEIHAIEA